MDGNQYFFVTHQRFRDLIQENAFIEHAEFSGNFYGTSFETVRHVEQLGRRCILDIEAQVCQDSFMSLPRTLGHHQGVRQIKETSLNPVYLFISPPSMTALRARLQHRGTETEVAVQMRLATALSEIRFAKESNVHDMVIVNDDLDRAYELFKRVAQGEKIVGDTLPPLDD